MQYVEKIKEEYRIKSNSNTHGGISERLEMPRSKYSSITHVDYSARIQTVRAHLLLA